MRKSSKQITAGAAAIALFALAALTATPAAAAPGYGARGDGDATQAVPGQENCVQSPGSTSYTPCWNNG
jgi:uncharacterized membrane protein